MEASASATKISSDDHGSTALHKRWTRREHSIRSSGSGFHSFLSLLVSLGVLLLTLLSIMTAAGRQWRNLTRVRLSLMLWGNLCKKIHGSASLTTPQKRHSVPCSFPVSGPQGCGILQRKAGLGILITDALFRIPENEEK